MFNKVKKIIKKYIPERLVRWASNLHFYCFASSTPHVPDQISIDPVNICNLSCPLCPTGSKKSNYEKSMMSYDTFKIIIQKMPGLKYINLFKWGEPFLNPDIFKMITYAKDQNIKVYINSNFSLKRNADFFTEIAMSGLDDLILSIDGASCQSYSRYRSSGNFDLIISNIKCLIHAKRLLKRSTPKITWKLIINKFNEHEIIQAKRMAHDLGVNFETSKINLGDDLPDIRFNDSIEQQKERWLPKNIKYVLNYYAGQYKRPLYDEPCKQLFNTFVVNPDGKVFPCCWMTDPKNIFGDLLKEPISKIWNNHKYLYSRSLFLQEKYLGPKEKTICYSCTNFRKNTWSQI